MCYSVSAAIALTDFIIKSSESEGLEVPSYARMKFVNEITNGQRRGKTMSPNLQSYLRRIKSNKLGPTTEGLHN